MPKAFGTFEGNFVLQKIVCKDCNDYFSRNLELQLGRATIEGLERIGPGRMTPDPNLRIGGGQSLIARVARGRYAGARAYLAPAEDLSKLVAHLYPQVGFCSIDNRHWFAPQDVPSKADLHALGFAPGSTFDLVFSPDLEPETVRQQLEDKGYSLAALSLTTIPEATQDSTVELELHGRIDRVVWRAIAKIACNYLAYHFPGIAFLPQLAEIRNYIRYDRLAGRSPVSVVNTPLLAGIPSGKAPVAHVIAVELQKGRLFASVSLYQYFHYRIVLADGGFLIDVSDESLRKGHLFNPIGREILELTKDVRRSRPFPTT